MSSDGFSPNAIGLRERPVSIEPAHEIRGGSRLGGRGGPLENFVGDVTKYVVRKAHCRVIVTAPSARDYAEAIAEGGSVRHTPEIPPAAPVA